jgi:hypothetical protein
VFYSDNGSTAVEVAIKLCGQYWAQNGRPARTRFIALDHAFHGETLGATSLGGVSTFTRVYAPWTFEVIRLPLADESTTWGQCLDTLGRLLRAHGDEVAGGTDPTNPDTDSDGFTDLVERTAGTSPTDPTSSVPPTDYFVVLPYNGDRAMRPLRFGTNISKADVFFLVDMTGSMGGERTNLIRGLVDTIIPGIAGAIPNVQFGAGGFDDYPTGSFGSAPDLPFYLLRSIGPADEDIGGWSIAAGPTTCPRSPGTSDIGRIGEKARDETRDELLGDRGRVEQHQLHVDALSEAHRELMKEAGFMAN